MTDGYDLPFEETPDPIERPAADLADELAARVVVMASSVTDEDGAVWPGLIFSFTTPDGRDLPRVLFCADPDAMRRLIPLITQSVGSAINHSTKGT